jgi:hypothetical protein
MLNEFGKEVCRLCGVELMYTVGDSGNLGPCKEVTKHEPWCMSINGEIQHRFDKTFAEIFNVLELALEDPKLEKAKDLIGDSICNTRNDCWDIINYFFKTSGMHLEDNKIKP